MKRGYKHTATWKGITRTMTHTHWSAVVGKSRTFIVSMLDEAERKGIPLENRLQYAIEQTPGERNTGNPLGRKSHGLPTVKKRRKVEADRNESLRGKAEEARCWYVCYLLDTWPAAHLHHGRSSEVVNE